MNNMRRRLHWIMGLRIALVTLILGLSLTFQAVKGGWVDTFYALIIVTYILTIPSAILLRVLTSPAALTILFWVQVGIDFSLETVLVARTGGIESPFAVSYVMTVAVASLVPRRRVGLLTACFCIILFGLLTNVQLYGLIDGWGWLAPSRLTVPETFQTFGVYALALLVVGILGGTLTEQLQQADQSLREKEQGLTRLQLFHENIVHSISSGVLRPMPRGVSRHSIRRHRKRPGMRSLAWLGAPGARSSTGILVNHQTKKSVVCCRQQRDSKWSVSAPTAIV